MRLSLLVPIYNAQDYLEACLDSAAAQPIDDMEVLCINDGSTDASLDIIRSYCERDARFRCIDKPNSGYGASMNRGLAEARGDYIGILESDDFIDTTMHPTLLALAEEHDADVVKSNFYFYWSHPQPVDELFEFARRDLCGTVFCPMDVRDVFYAKPSIWSAVYKRSFLEQNGITFLETPGASYQDAAFNFKVWCAAERALCIYDAFLHYRQDNEASSVNSAAKVYCVCDEYAEMYRYLEETFPDKRAALEPVLAKMQFDTYMWNYERLADTFKVEWIERFAQDMRANDERGIIDRSLFDKHRRSELDLLLVDPQLLHAKLSRESTGAQGKADGVRYYLEHGGMRSVLRMARHRLAQR